jgi:hypothetical protein
MKRTGLWTDPNFLRHAIPPEEDKTRVYPSTKLEPRWFRSTNVIPIESHERFGLVKGPPQAA